MRGRKVQGVVGILLVVTIIFAGFIPAVLFLWNWLMPVIFGLRQITYWQSLGLLLLSWTLFGGLRGWGMGHRPRGFMRERWDQMSPEEREKFRQGMRGGCGPFRAGTGETKV
jgi:hypothetical protein